MEISEQLARQLLESIENGFINETTISKFRYWHLDAVMNMTKHMEHGRETFWEIKSYLEQMNIERLQKQEKIIVGFITSSSQDWIGDELYWLLEKSEKFEPYIFVMATYLNGRGKPLKRDYCETINFFQNDFYDVSQSFEMRRAEYKVLVPYQETPWVIHDSSFAKLTYYDEARKICLKEYPEYLYADGGFEFTYDKEWNDLSDLLADQIKALIAAHEWKQVGQIIDSYRGAGRKSSEIEILGILYDIYEKEKTAGVKNSFFMGCRDYQEIYEKYMSVRFLMRRMELGLQPVSYQELWDAIAAEQISYETLEELILRATVDKNKVLERLIKIYKIAGMKNQVTACEKLFKIIERRTISITYSRMQ